jgi:hypothetical protein
MLSYNTRAELLYVGIAQSALTSLFAKSLELLRRHTKLLQLTLFKA